MTIFTAADGQAAAERLTTANAVADYQDAINTTVTDQDTT